jgi:hypothetical protein
MKTLLGMALMIGSFAMVAVHGSAEVVSTAAAAPVAAASSQAATGEDDPVCQYYAVCYETGAVFNTLRECRSVCFGGCGLENTCNP